MANDSSTGGFLAATSSPPPEDDAFDVVLQSLVAGVTGLPGNLIRPRWQRTPPPQPEPFVNWCAIGVTEESPEVHAVNVATIHAASGPGAPDGLSATFEYDDITVLVSFYGPAARGNCTLLRSGLMVAQNREALFLAGLSLVRIPGRFTFAPDMVNNQTVRRVDMSLSFRRATVLTWPILNIVKVQGTFNAMNTNGAVTSAGFEVALS